MKKSFHLVTLFMVVCCVLLTGCTEKNGRISSVDDLKDKRIGVLQGSVHDIYATKTFPKATILQYKSPSDMILAVKSGKIDAGIYTSDELVDLIRHQPEVTVFGPPLFSSDLGLGFHRENGGLRLSFNRFLHQIRKNGVYDDMVNRWMNKGESSMPDIPKVESGAPLVVGLVSDNGLPFTAVKDNRLVGFNIELLERFAVFSGRKLTYLDMQFGSLIPALASKKIDMIGAVMWITEERKKQIDFSDPYYVQGANFFALRKNIIASGKPPEPMH
ncbi:MAG: transporter substrate-binding domain-containing protein [Chlorobiaceae bacterium]|nr:transporter substrate-binding domain-containing protein [Chlorobiaceae bacterium]